MTLEELKENIEEVPTSYMTDEEYYKKLDDAQTEDEYQEIKEDNYCFVERGYERIRDLLNDYDCEHDTDLEDICAYVWDYDLAYDFLLHEITKNEPNGSITGIEAALLTLGPLEYAYDNTYYYIDGYHKLHNFMENDLEELKADVLAMIEDMQRGER